MAMQSGEPKDDIVVREKASKRKSRTGVVSRVARTPTQERSRRRYQAILAATEKLLESADIENISLYDIAGQADLAPASVHYLFNTVAAVHVALNAQYNEQITQKVMASVQSMASEANPSWQNWTRSIMAAAAQELNEYRPRSEIMLGPTLHRASRRANWEMNQVIAVSIKNVLGEVFVVPDIPKLERYYAYATEIGESLWAASYAEHGQINSETFEESVRAVISYLRCFLPEFLPQRRTA